MHTLSLSLYIYIYIYIYYGAATGADGLDSRQSVCRGLESADYAQGEEGARVRE